MEKQLAYVFAPMAVFRSDGLETLKDTRINGPGRP